MTTRTLSLSSNTWKREIVITGFFAVITAIGAQITIQLPFSPVPVTMQVMMVILSGLILGSKRGFASQIAYLAAGLAGLPVFSAGMSGLPALFGPTGGYLLAFPFAAFVAGWIRQRAIRRMMTLNYLAASLAAIGVIYGAGVLWLGHWLGQGMNTVALVQAWKLGCAPFIAVDLVKAVSATVAVRTGQETLLRLFGTLYSLD
jgi:biotin transport system substrate-specific component